MTLNHTAFFRKILDLNNALVFMKIRRISLRLGAEVLAAKWSTARYGNTIQNMVAGSAVI